MQKYPRPAVRQDTDIFRFFLLLPKLSPEESEKVKAGGKRYRKHKNCSEQKSDNRYSRDKHTVGKPAESADYTEHKQHYRIDNRYQVERVALGIVFLPLLEHRFALRDKLARVGIIAFHKILIAEG